MSLPFPFPFPTTVEQEILFACWTGYGALFFFFLSQIISPLAPFLKKKTSLYRQKNKIRKWAGLTAAWLTLFHSLGLFFTFLRGNQILLIEEPWLNAGLAAAIIFTLLLITSYVPLMRLLKQFWKPLHLLSYLIWFLVGAHLWGAPYAPSWASLSAIIIGSLKILFALKGLRLKSLPTH